MKLSSHYKTNTDNVSDLQAISHSESWCVEYESVTVIRQQVITDMLTSRTTSPLHVWYYSYTEVLPNLVRVFSN